MLADQLRGLVGAGQRRRHQHRKVQAHLRQLPAGGACLLATGVVERNIRDALHEVRLVPIGLAVTDQGERGVLSTRRNLFGAQLGLLVVHEQAVDGAVQVLQGHLGQGGVDGNRVETLLGEAVGALPQQGVHHQRDEHAVGCHQHGLAVVLAAHAVQGRQAAGDEFLRGFHAVLLTGFAGGEHQLASGDLPLQLAEGALLEPGHGTPVGHVQAFGHNLGAFGRAAQGRGEHQVDDGAFITGLLQRVDGGAHLVAAGVVEGNVGAALETVVDVPIGLPVAHKNDAGSVRFGRDGGDDGGVLCVGHPSSIPLVSASSRGRSHTACTPPAVPTSYRRTRRIAPSRAASALFLSVFPYFSALRWRAEPPRS